jgi:hypothetical protein
MMRHRTGQAIASLTFCNIFFVIVSLLTSSSTTRANLLHISSPTATLPGGSGKIMFSASPRGVDNLQICVLDVAVFNERCFENLAVRDWQFMQWHPDGRHIMVRNGSKYYSLDTETGDYAELLQFRNFSALTLSPDASKVAYLETEDGETTIYIANFDGSDKHKVSQDLILNLLVP